MCLTYLFRLIFEGPSHWYEEFPVAKEGKRQSPIDLSAELAQTDAALRTTPLAAKYVDKNILNVENTGASWKVNVDGKGSSLTGGALAGEYELWQFHAHWDSEDNRGSEHTVEGKMYPAEVSCSSVHFIIRVVRKAHGFFCSHCRKLIAFEK